MLDPHVRSAQGGGNPLLSAAEVHSKKGYFKQTKKQFNKKFGLDGKGKGRQALRDFWKNNLSEKEQGLEEVRKQFYGDFKPASKRDFRVLRSIKIPEENARRLHDQGKTEEALENIKTMLESDNLATRSAGVRKACHLLERMFDYINNAHKSVISPISNIDTPCLVELAAAKKTRNKSIQKHKEEGTPAANEKMQKAVEIFLDRCDHAAEKRNKMLQEMIEDIALKRRCKE
ncbi:predicted protein [Chaetoceros tenuissimus]|uniref:Uncharacterized protein n=1 Tax=Chaetoceros tenuissimus TaxID=426638 RepID=A0AAD3CRK3_9STRA|nr:predicted protein [Chaetoceros tenuissimus]